MQPESLFIHMTLVETKAAAAAAHIERHTLYNRECFSKMYGCQTSRRNTLLRKYGTIQLAASAANGRVCKSP